MWRTEAGGARSVRLPAGEPPASDSPAADSPARDLAQALAQLIARYPPLRTHLLDEKGHLRATLNLFVNGEHIRYRGGLAAPLQDGDEVYIVPMIAGGSCAVDENLQIKYCIW